MKRLIFLFLTPFLSHAQVYDLCMDSNGYSQRYHLNDNILKAQKLIDSGVLIELNKDLDKTTLKGSFKVFDSDSVEYKVIYNYKTKMVYIRDFRLKSKYESFCDVDSNSSKDYKLLFNHRFTNEMNSFHYYSNYDDEINLDYTLHPPYIDSSLTNKKGKFILINDTCAANGYETDSLPALCQISHGILNNSDCDSLIKLLNNNSYKIYSFCHFPDLLIELQNNSNEVFLKFEYVFGCSSFVAELNDGKRISGTLLGDSYEQLKHLLLSKGTPNKHFKMIENFEKQQTKETDKIERKYDLIEAQRKKRIAKLIKKH